MYIRKGFVTNSSSTSYAAYGIPLPEKYAPEKEEDSEYEMDWDTFYRKKTGLSWNDMKVGFDHTGEADDAVMYVNKSRQSVEYGYAAVCVVTPDEWDGEIKQACETLGVEYKQPSWFIWHTGMEG